MKGKREAFHPSAFVVLEAIADASVELEIVFRLGGYREREERRWRVGAKETRFVDCPAIVTNNRIA